MGERRRHEQQHHRFDRPPMPHLRHDQRVRTPDSKHEQGGIEHLSPPEAVSLTKRQP